MGDRLAGRRAILTGGCSGIGKAIAEAFTEEGACVSILDIRTETFEELERSLDGETLTFECDIRNTEDVERAVSETVSEWGGIDVVVNNAGVVSRQDILNTTDEDMEYLLDVMLKGTMRVARATMGHLQDSEGSMVNISSTAAIGGIPKLPSYTAAKGGVSSLTRQLAVDYAEDGVTVNAILPGTTRTPINEPKRQEDPDWEDAVESQTPIGRLATPDDYKGLAIFLASDESSYITGQNLVVDGGVSAQWRVDST